MAVLGASRAFKEWQTANGMVEPDAAGGEEIIQDSEVPATAQTEGEADTKDYTDRELQALEDEDPLSLIDSLSSRVVPAMPSGIGSSTLVPLLCTLLVLLTRCGKQSSRSRTTCRKRGDPNSTSSRKPFSLSSRELALSMLL